ncbi:MAG: hypothetical protein SR2Q5_08160 [Quinella sp. 2Q5]|nr:hypothetical protein [Quinella sp. 2Q5]
MRKIIFMAVAIFFALTGTAFAAEGVGAVIIGGAEFKTSDFYEVVRSEFKPDGGTKVIAGDELQTLYKRYWLKRGYIGEQPPQKEDLVSFAQMSGCDKIIFLMVTDTVDTQNSSNHRQKTRISVQVDAYLCTRTDVVDVFSASDDEDSKGSPLRARRGAFRKCLRSIGKSLNREI